MVKNGDIKKDNSNQLAAEIKVGDLKLIRRKIIFSQSLQGFLA
jgi:hypothetical protein